MPSVAVEVVLLIPGEGDVDAAVDVEELLDEVRESVEIVTLLLVPVDTSVLDPPVAVFAALEVPPGDEESEPPAADTASQATVSSVSLMRVGVLTLTE